MNGDYFKKKLKLKVIHNNCNATIDGNKVRIITPMIVFDEGITKGDTNKIGYYIRFELEPHKKTKFMNYFRCFCFVLLSKLQMIYPKSHFCYRYTPSGYSEEVSNFYLIKGQVVFKFEKFDTIIKKEDKEIGEFEAQKVIQEELINKPFKGKLELELQNIWHLNGVYGFHWVVKTIII